MEEQTQKRGTVTSLASLFPPEETHKASERVQNAISERWEHLGQLKKFIADNANLINLVQTLPNELHHNIMVRNCQFLILYVCLLHCLFCKAF